METRKSKRGKYEIEDFGTIEVPKDVDRKVRRLMKLAEQDCEPVRVNFRWQVGPLELVKDVAAAMGVPYQTYMKQVLYQQALTDFERIGKKLEDLEAPPSKPKKKK